MNGNGNAKVREWKRKNFSKQIRFSPNPRDFFASLFSWINRASIEEVAYTPVSSARDTWLRNFVKLEPNLLGVLSTVVDIDKNRGWRMVGGRNQVMRFTDVLHHHQAAPGLWGWRASISMSSASFWGTDMGSVTEIGREGRNGPMRALYTVDPTKCTLTGDPQYPLQYSDLLSHKKWRETDYFRATSMPSTEDAYHGLGYCAVSRCIELAKLMIAVYQYDRETLGSQAPSGLLLLQGISQQQWKESMEARADDLEGRDLDYFANVAVLASKGADLDAKLLALANLPTSFNLREWMDMLIFGYALCFGFDASEFWPVQFGALGRGTETEIQAEKASGKGRLDFPLTYQEQLQEFLPETLDFAFDQRDDKGDLLKAQVHQAQITVVKTMYEAGQASPQGNLLSKLQSLTVAADYGLIPREWATLESMASTDLEDSEGEIFGAEEFGEETSFEASSFEAPEENGETPGAAKEQSRFISRLAPRGSTVRILRDELLSKNPIARAAVAFPQEPIVQYSWPEEITTILWESGEDLLKPRYYATRSQRIRKSH